MYFYSILSSIFFLPPSSFSRDKRPGRSQIPLILPFTFGGKGMYNRIPFSAAAKNPGSDQKPHFFRTQDRYHLRWFTPAGEIDLCGHATLAAAFVVLTKIEPQKNTVIFETLSGNLTVTRTTACMKRIFPPTSSGKFR